MTEEWLGMDDIWYVTGKIMSKDDRARFTFEFDAWVSEEGQQVIEDYIYDRHTAGLTDEDVPDFQIIFGEWYAQDEAAAGREEEWFNGR